MGLVEDTAADAAARALREVEALVAVSSPSGDVAGAEEAVAVTCALLPPQAEVERLPCSSPGHAADLLATLRGTGRGRVLLLGHLDTVVAHDAHRSPAREDRRLLGSGTIDMKGGDVLALCLLRALAARPADFAEAALLLVCDEEWRTAPFAHAERFAGWDASLCFEAGQTNADGVDEVVVRRKAAGTLHVRARGQASHSGSAPDKGRNALLGLAEAATAVAAQHAPDGPDRLTAVPTVLRSGDAFNVVPDDGELFCDLRADRDGAFDEVLAALPAQTTAGVDLEATLRRRWPPLDAREVAAPVLERASALLGRPILAGGRGGASDASHLATTVPLSIDGLGPRGGGAHAPHEHLLVASLVPRAEVAAAVCAAVLA